MFLCLITLGLSRAPYSQDFTLHGKLFSVYSLAVMRAAQTGVPCLAHRCSSSLNVIYPSASVSDAAGMTEGTRQQLPNSQHTQVDKSQSSGFLVMGANVK